MKTMQRRTFLKAVLAAVPMVVPQYLSAETELITPLVPGSEIDRFKKRQSQLLAKCAVPARSRYLKLGKPPLTAHVLEVGQGDPLVLIHGGAAMAVQFAPLLSGLLGSFRCFAPDRPGCGLTDKFDYVGVPFRQHAVDFVGSLLDELKLPKTAIAGNSMGGYWALVFALAPPERVTRLVLLGGVAGSPPEGRRPPNAPEPSIENARAAYHRLMANGDRASRELLEAEYAAKCLPGAKLGWNSMLEQIWREGGGTGITYALRPELKNLKPSTLFIWGDKD
jgi:pimeloyl-ACP methyl ester carboxylesterase